jgi:hydroxymethylpyrimidine pyrophosphatase-like HAD family hydrolase
MALRCVYCDLDGTLLGPGGSLFAAPTGGTTLLGARAVEACHRADVELCVMTGRRQDSASANARMLGFQSYIFEIGAAFVLDGEEHWLTGDWVPRDGQTIYERIEASGAPALLLEHFAGQLEYHDPWHRGRLVSHLLRGDVDVADADALLSAQGLGALRLVDNGIVHRRSAALEHLAITRAYHLLPAGASKSGGVAAHMRARGYTREECIAIGDSREDLAVSAHVDQFFLVANAADRDASIRDTVALHDNAYVTEAGYGEGVYEAIVSTLALRR